MKLLTADHMMTMADADGVRVRPDAGIAVENGAIVTVDTRDSLLARYPGAENEHMAGILMPGLVNVHCHSGMLRGTAEAMEVWEWLTWHINPMHRMLRPDEARAASWMAYGESLLAGTTTVVDMWRYMDGSAAVAEEIGIRLVAVPYVGEHPDYNYFDTLDMNERLIDLWQGGAGGRVTVWVGLEHPFYTTPEACRRAADMAKANATRLHTHCSEAKIEVAEFVTRYGVPPVMALAKMGLLDAPMMLAHAVWLDDDEVALAAERGVSIAHNPVSNMKLASGIAPMTAMRAAGLCVGLGTDGEKENNNLDMFEEMKAASLVGKLRAMDASATDFADVLRLATFGGAEAIGQADQIGSLEVGKRADAIVVRTDTPRTTPIFPHGRHANIHHNLVHAVRGSDVSTVMVDGYRRAGRCAAESVAS